MNDLPTSGVVPVEAPSTETRNERNGLSRNWDGWDEWEAELTDFLSMLASRNDEIGRRADGLGQFLPELRVAFSSRKTAENVKEVPPCLT